MKPHQRITTYAISFTTIVVFSIWKLIYQIMLLYPNWFKVLDHEKYNTLGIILLGLISAGVYKTFFIAIDYLMRNFQWVKRVILSSYYMEGTWIGFYIGVSGKVRFMIETYEQTMDDLVIKGISFDENKNLHTFWTSESYNINAESGELIFQYKVKSTHEQTDPNGIAYFNLNRKNNKKATDFIVGYSVDSHLGKKCRAIEMKLSDSTKYDLKETLGRTIQFHEEYKDYVFEYKKKRTMSNYHDPSEYIRGLQQLLISDKKKIAFLFGAGTSLSKKNKDSKNIPAVGRLTIDIESEVIDSYKGSGSPIPDAYTQLKDEIGEEKYTIESLLSLLEIKREVVGNGLINGLNKAQFNTLIDQIKTKIREKISIHQEAEKKIENVIQADFADWIKKADRKFAIEIFTTNYDYLFEIGLENKSVPYYDGFTGGYKPFFNSESVDDINFLPHQTKLWKIHGSLGWHFDDGTKKVWRKDSDSEDMLIYPSTLKYNDSKKQPYTALGDRLTNFLKQPDTILITCGYSFNDEHINERILTALSSNTTAHVYALYYDKLYKDGNQYGFSFTEDSSLSCLAKSNNKLSVFGCKNAVIGCKYGEWRLKREPDKDDPLNVKLYFNESFFPNPEDEINLEFTGGEVWTGEGELILPDFKKFVDFLQSMIFEPHSVKE